MATVVTKDTTINVVSVGKQGPQGPPGEVLQLYSDLKAKGTGSLTGGETVYVGGRDGVGDGGQGFFHWVTGDQSSEITNDPGEWEWVPPGTDTSGASGAWERQSYETLLSDRTVNIPSDYLTLQDAIDAQSRWPVGVTSDGARAKIVLNIEASHQPESGIYAEGGDFGHFWIESADATVTLPATFTGTVVTGSLESFCGTKRGTAPVLNCLIDASTNVDIGYYLEYSSHGRVETGAGVKNCVDDNVRVMRSSTFTTSGGIFSGAGAIGVRVSTASHAELENIDASGAGTHGVLFSRGCSGLVSGDCTNATTTGVRIQRSIITLGGVNALDVSSAGEDGIYALLGSTVGARTTITANNCGRGAVRAEHGSVAGLSSFLSADSATATGVLAYKGSTVSLDASTVTGSGSNDLAVLRGSFIQAHGVTTSSSGGSGNNPDVNDCNVSSFNAISSDNGIIWA